MKKIVAIVFLFLIMSSCLADSVDLDSMNLHQLLELEQEVHKKIYEYDPSSEWVLYQGTYIVGKDLEAGGYLFQCIDLTPDTVRISICNRDSNGNVVEFEYVDLGEVYHIHIDDGQTLIIDGGVVSYLRR